MLGWTMSSTAGSGQSSRSMRHTTLALLDVDVSSLPKFSGMVEDCRRPSGQRARRAHRHRRRNPPALASSPPATEPQRRRRKRTNRKRNRTRSQRRVAAQAAALFSPAEFPPLCPLPEAAPAPATAAAPAPPARSPIEAAERALTYASAVLERRRMASRSYAACVVGTKPKLAPLAAFLAARMAAAAPPPARSHPRGTLLSRLVPNGEFLPAGFRPRRSPVPSLARLPVRTSTDATGLRLCNKRARFIKMLVRDRPHQTVLCPLWAVCEMPLATRTSMGPAPSLSSVKKTIVRNMRKYSVRC